MPGSATNINAGDLIDEFVTIDADQNNHYMNINTNFDGITLSEMRLGSYVNIILQQSNNYTFNSQFESDQSTSTTVNYASGLTYNIGANSDDIDVFYISCISQTSALSKLLVNHQRYHQ